MAACFSVALYVVDVTEKSFRRRGLKGIHNNNWDLLFMLFIVQGNGDYDSINDVIGSLCCYCTGNVVIMVIMISVNCNYGFGSSNNNDIALMVMIT